MTAHLPSNSEAAPAEYWATRSPGGGWVLLVARAYWADGLRHYTQQAVGYFPAIPDAALLRLLRTLTRTDDRTTR